MDQTEAQIPRCYKNKFGVKKFSLNKTSNRANIFLNTLQTENMTGNRGLNIKRKNAKRTEQLDFENALAYFCDVSRLCNFLIQLSLIFEGDIWEYDLFGTGSDVTLLDLSGRAAFSGIMFSPDSNCKLSKRELKRSALSLRQLFTLHILGTIVYSNSERTREVLWFEIALIERGFGFQLLSMINIYILYVSFKEILIYVHTCVYVCIYCYSSNFCYNKHVFYLFDISANQPFKYFASGD